VAAKAADFNESVKRTTDDKSNASERFSRPLHGLAYIRVSKPSAEALGYFHSVRFADEGELLLQQSRVTFLEPSPTVGLTRPLRARYKLYRITTPLPSLSRKAVES